MKHNSVLQRSIARLSPESIELSRMAFDLSDKLADILQKKGMTQHDLAVSIGRSETEVAKWLGGTQTFNLKTIALLQSFLGEPLVKIP